MIPDTKLHEPADVPLRAVGVGGLIVVAITVLALLVSGWTLARERRTPAPGAELVHPLASARELPPEPRLESDPDLLLRETRAEQEARLGTYRWVDRGAGVVAIPIERAMELLVEEARREGGR